MNTLLATYRTYAEDSCGNDAVCRPGHPEDVDRAAREGTPRRPTLYAPGRCLACDREPGTRDAQIWVVTITDTGDQCDEPDLVCVFDEGLTELDVIQELWDDWVFRPWQVDKAADPEGMEGEPPGSVCATWAKLTEWVGEDWVFTRELRTIKVKVL